MKIKKEQIQSFLIDSGIDWIDKEERGEFLINSPFTFDSKKKAGINYKKGGVFHCFKTGTGGSFFFFVKEIKNFDNDREARNWFIRNYFTLEEVSSTFLNKSNNEETEQEPDNALNFPYGTVAFDRKKHYEYYEYLKKRYFSDDIIDSMKIFVSEHERRLVFPTYDYAGNLEFYARRTIDPKNELRWLNSASQGKNPVWNIQNVGEIIYIFEGIFDAVRVFPRGVAIFGNTLRDGQAKKILARNPYKIIVVCDGDEPGRYGQRRTANKLAQLHKNVWIHLWDKKGPKDFGDMDKIKLNEIPWDAAGKLTWELNEKS
jgi:DNA primase